MFIDRNGDFTMTSTTRQARAASRRRAADSAPFVASKALAGTLQGVLSDLLELQSQAKQAHWNIVGPTFRSLHLQLDDVASTARASADTVAERMRALGADPDGRSDTVARTTTLPELSSGRLETSTAASLILGRLHTVAGVIREASPDIADEDTSTGDLLNVALQELEEHAWMLRDQLETPTAESWSADVRTIGK
jgi:starvation-inducible DNA-binding protein